MGRILEQRGYDRGPMAAESPEKLIASNKKAFHEYFVLQKVEAGLELTGTEVKSLRDGRAELKDSYVIFKNGEAFLFGAHIAPYSHGNLQNHDPDRARDAWSAETSPPGRASDSKGCGSRRFPHEERPRAG